MMTDCPATHTSSVQAVSSVWKASLRGVGGEPTKDSLRKWCLQLSVGLIPVDLHPLFSGDPSKRSAFFGKLSVGMIEWFGARMRERELLRLNIGQRPPSALQSGGSDPPPDPDPRPVPPVPASERTRLWRLRQSIDLPSWIRLMGPEALVDSSSVRRPRCILVAPVGKRVWPFPCRWVSPDKTGNLGQRPKEGL